MPVPRAGIAHNATKGGEAVRLHAFNDLEGVRIAAEMESRGEQFYRRAARVSKSPETIALLDSLADDEVLHRQEFVRLYQDACAHYQREGIPCVDYDEETNAYLSAIAADVVFPEGLMTLRRQGFESPEAILAAAIDSEKDSILFYTELAARTGDGHARDLFLEIVRQERGHLSRLQKRLAEL